LEPAPVPPCRLGYPLERAAARGSAPPGTEAQLARRRVIPLGWRAVSRLSPDRYVDLGLRDVEPQRNQIARHRHDLCLVAGLGPLVNLGQGKDVGVRRDIASVLDIYTVASDEIRQTIRRYESGALSEVSAVEGA
jgi:hypothetical protein